MANQKLRRQIVVEAARLMFHRRETEYSNAKLRAARQYTRRWMKPSELPSNREIREEIHLQAHLYEGPGRYAELREIRLQVLQLMQQLSRLQPRVTTSTLVDHLRLGTDIEISISAHSPEFVQDTLDDMDITFTIKENSGANPVPVRVLLCERVGVELKLDTIEQRHEMSEVPTSEDSYSRLSICEFEQFIVAEYDESRLNISGNEPDEEANRFSKFRALMLPLEMVHQNRKRHPEGDALYHSLQVFDLARDELPYDEEFLLAALLHDVGKAIDPSDHVQAGLDVLNGTISDRSAWLIANHPLAHSYRDGTIGARALRRIRRSDDFDELMLLGRCDRDGRLRGVIVPELDDALTYIRQLDRLYE